ncbi:SulP family inorganic anion transporter [Streptomyces sp. BI20]|uniref:SulP family inorganic anion transporter n=1 Tax=Streptomyces sp. BI20 TaxID=3403460 RepID=UPI003C71A66E
MPGLGAVRGDLGASVVVALTALPLCVGIAVASGVPVGAGIVTGVVGGLVVGVLGGGAAHVSGPAVGLAAVVYGAVREFGLPALGVLVFAAGVVQVALGLLRCGRWFGAVSAAVTRGMLVGVGAVLLLGWSYAVGGAVDRWAVALGVGTVGVSVLWGWAPGRWRVVPGPLVGVGAATLVAWAWSIPVARVRVEGVWEAFGVPDGSAFGVLGSASAWGTVVALALIASAGSLCAVAAVDRAGTDPDRELVAQGVGNAVCGALGVLPLAAVLVRSAANVAAGARTRAARVLQGVWLGLFAVVAPQVVGAVPVAAVAGVLAHAVWRVVPVRAAPGWWRGRRGELVVSGVTAVAVVAGGLGRGLVAGLAVAGARAVWEGARVRLEPVGGIGGPEGVLWVRVVGNARFVRVPRLLERLDELPADRVVRLDLGGLRCLDHGCLASLDAWERRRAARTPPPGGRPTDGCGERTAG